MEFQKRPIHVAELVGAQGIWLLSSVALTARRRDPALRLSGKRKADISPRLREYGSLVHKEAVVRETD